MSTRKSTALAIDGVAVTGQVSKADHIDRVYREHSGAVYSHCLRLCRGNTAFAEDITQEVFIKLIKHLDSLVDIHKLTNWLYTVATREFLNRARKDKVRCYKWLQWVGFKEHHNAHEDRASARQLLGNALARSDALPPAQRTVFCMFHLDGKKQTEIATILGFSKGYVSRLLKRAEVSVRNEGNDV